MKDQEVKQQLKELMFLIIQQCILSGNQSGRKTTISGLQVRLKLTNGENMTRLLKVHKRQGLWNR